MDICIWDRVAFRIGLAVWLCNRPSGLCPPTSNACYVLLPLVLHLSTDSADCLFFMQLIGKIRDMLRSSRPVASTARRLGTAETLPLSRPSLLSRATRPLTGRCSRVHGASVPVRSRLSRRGARIFVFTPTRPMPTANSEPATEPPNLPYRLAAEQQLRKWLGLRQEDILNVVTVSQLPQFLVGLRDLLASSNC
jgi:hypothetical protein